MNVKQLKKLILEEYPEINLVDLGMEDLAKTRQSPVFLRDILETEVSERYSVKSDIVLQIVKTREWGERFTCLKTEKFSN